jgi:hypothetical protein
MEIVISIIIIQGKKNSSIEDIHIKHRQLQTYTSNTRFRLRFIMIQKQTHSLVFTQLHYIETLKTPTRY